MLEGTSLFVSNTFCETQRLTDLTCSQSLQNEGYKVHETSVYLLRTVYCSIEVWVTHFCIVFTISSSSSESGRNDEMALWQINTPSNDLSLTFINIMLNVIIIILTVGGKCQSQDFFHILKLQATDAMRVGHYSKLRIYWMFTSFCCWQFSNYTL